MHPLGPRSTLLHVLLAAPSDPVPCKGVRCPSHGSLRMHGRPPAVLCRPKSRCSNAIQQWRSACVLHLELIEAATSSAAEQTLRPSLQSLPSPSQSQPGPYGGPTGSAVRMLVLQSWNERPLSFRTCAKPPILAWHLRTRLGSDSFMGAGDLRNMCFVALRVVLRLVPARIPWHKVLQDVYDEPVCQARKVRVAFSD